MIFAILGLRTAFADPSPNSAAPLTRIADVRALTPAHAGQGLPVRLQAVVTYYQPAEQMLYVQDDSGAIYIHATKTFSVHPGSKVTVNGVTAASYRNTVLSADVVSTGEDPLPAPRPASFEDLINGVIDCDYVMVKGVVHSSTIQQQDGTPFLSLEMLVDGSPVRVHVLNYSGIDLNGLLDAEISVAGATGKTFDGKFEPVGVELYVDPASSIHILTPSSVHPWALPLSSFDRVSQTYGPHNQGQRIRVRGIVTLFDPGEILVLDQDRKTLLVHTHQDGPLSIGQIVDAIGFPDYSDYGPSLSYGQFAATPQTGTVNPLLISFEEAMTGKHSFNLVSLSGRLVAEVHETLQDTLLVESGGHVVSAVFRSRVDLPNYQIGSTLRLTGVCLIEAYGPYNSPVDFTLRLRSPDDVIVVGLPSLMTVGRLVFISALLLTVVVCALLWVITLRRRVVAQTETIRRSAEEDAAWERRSVYLEKERGQVLESINSSKPLDSVLELIAAFISKQIWGLSCTFHITSPEAARLSRTKVFAPESHTGMAPEGGSYNVRTIKSGDGEEVAEMILVASGEWRSSAHIEEVLDIGARLAALAIENRMLHEKLVHRSEYDQLTDVPNRFMIESRLEHAIGQARESDSHLAVIYIDLDEFKQVNDLFGHRIGDLYLKQTAQRLTAQLRDRDLIARIGGDEFLAIVHEVQGREEADGVASRLASCFNDPFSIEDFHIRGAASIGVALYPEDGQDGEELKRTADHAMYSLKRRTKISVVPNVS